MRAYEFRVVRVQPYVAKLIRTHYFPHVATTNLQEHLRNILYLFHVYHYSRFRNETQNHAKITCLLNKLTYTAIRNFFFEIFY